MACKARHSTGLLIELPLLARRLQVRLVGFELTRLTPQGELLIKRQINKRAHLSP